jgi:hypothetical protein
MIPHTQRSVVGLFDHLAKPEKTTRHHDAGRTTAGRTKQVPNAANTNTEDDSDFADDDIWFE